MENYGTITKIDRHWGGFTMKITLDRKISFLHLGSLTETDSFLCWNAHFGECQEGDQIELNQSAELVSIKRQGQEIAINKGSKAYFSIEGMTHFIKYNIGMTNNSESSSGSNKLEVAANKSVVKRPQKNNNGVAVSKILGILGIISVAMIASELVTKKVLKKKVKK